MAARLVTEPGRRSRVLLVGAGHTHVEVLRRYAASPDPFVQLTLLDPSPFCQYSGMIPGVIAGQFAVRELRVDVAALVSAADGALVVGSAVGLDLASRRIICDTLPPIDYDLLSLDIGAAPALPLAGQSSCDCIVTKPADTFLQQVEALVDRHLARAGRSRVAIVGGGAAAIELALALCERLTATSHRPDGEPSLIQIVLICKSETLAPDLSAATRQTTGSDRRRPWYRDHDRTCGDVRKRRRSVRRRPGGYCCRRSHFGDRGLGAGVAQNDRTSPRQARLCPGQRVPAGGRSA